MIAGTLKGIIGQRLIRTKSGYRAAVCEVMVTTGRIRDFIMDPAQTGHIEQAIAEGEYYGMRTFDQALLKLVEEDRVDYEEAIRISSRPQDFKLMVYALGREEDAGESRDQDGPGVVRRGARAAVDSRFRGNDE
jgi:twitching motility protein PilT